MIIDTTFTINVSILIHFGEAIERWCMRLAVFWLLVMRPNATFREARIKDSWRVIYEQLTMQENWKMI
jgi:hypothetical protein